MEKEKSHKFIAIALGLILAIIVHVIVEHLLN